MNDPRAAELRSILRQELAILDSEIAELQTAIRERRTRAIVIADNRSGYSSFQDR